MCIVKLHHHSTVHRLRVQYSEEEGMEGIGCQFGCLSGARMQSPELNTSPVMLVPLLGG